MKKTLLIISLSALSLSSFAQMSAVVYSEAGETFTLYLNGKAQNTSPATNVKVENLTSEFYQARVDFEDKSFPDFSNNNFACHPGMEVTYIIKKNKKGEYVMRYYTENAIGSAPVVNQTTPQNNVQTYTVVEDQPVQQTLPNNTNTGGIQVNMNVPTDGQVTNTTTSTTTTVTNAKTNPGNGNVGINMNVNGTETGINMNVSGTNATNPNVGMNVNVDGTNLGLNMNVTDPAFQQSGVVTTTTTSTTTTSHSSTNQTSTHQNTEPAHSKPVVAEGPCAHSMDDASFAKAKATVESKGFDETKLTQAKQITKANCLTSDQIKDMISVFGFEETKLAYAKFAYDYCFDKNNYYTINDAFSFESTIEELNKFLETK